MTELPDNHPDRLVSTFESRLAEAPMPFRGAVIDVLDTAHLVSLWLKAHELPTTADHIIALTKLILARERERLSDFEAGDQ